MRKCHAAAPGGGRRSCAPQQFDSRLATLPQSFRPFDGNNTTSHSIRNSNGFVLKHSLRFRATGKTPRPQSFQKALDLLRHLKATSLAARAPLLVAVCLWVVVVAAIFRAFVFMPGPSGAASHYHLTKNITDNYKTY